MSKKRRMNKEWRINIKTDPSKWFSRSLWLWALSLLVFGGLIYYLTVTHQTVLDRGAQWSWYVMVVDVVVGTLAFFLMILFKVLGQPELKGVGLIVAIVLFLGGVGLASAYFDDRIRTQKTQAEISPPPTVTPTGVLTPTPTLTQIVSPTITPKKINTEQFSPKYDGSRTGNIISYKEWCTGKQISIYENELTKGVANDGKTYYMTVGDWNCYDKNSLVAKQLSNTQTNYPPCIVYYPSLGYSKTYNYTSPSDCSYWQQIANTTTQQLSLPKIEIAEPYQYSQEYLDSIEKFNKEISKPLPTPFVLPTPTPTSPPSGCFGSNCYGPQTFGYP